MTFFERFFRPRKEQTAKPAQSNAALDKELLPAISNKDALTVGNLLKKGLDVNAKDNQGKTALMLASGNVYRDVETVKVLLAAKADVNAKDNQGETALMEACSSGMYNEEIVKMLLAAKADVKVKNQYGYTALSYASASKPEVVKLLKGKSGGLSEQSDSKSTIKALSIVLESDTLSMFGSAMITPPASMVQSIDQELSKSGYIRPGEFVAFIKKNGFGQPKIMNALTDSERLAVLRSLFPNDRWACCGRVTEMNRYNVVVAFWK